MALTSMTVLLYKVLWMMQILNRILEKKRLFDLNFKYCFKTYFKKHEVIPGVSGVYG